MSSQTGTPTTATEADASVRLPLALPSDFRTRFAKLNAARFMSRGHLQDRFAVDVYANDSGKALYDGKVDVGAEGAMLVKDGFDRMLTGDRPGPIMAMVKRERGFDPDNGDWRYLVISARGELLADGKIERCAGCHGEAPRDHVFRTE